MHKPILISAIAFLVVALSASRGATTGTQGHCLCPHWPINPAALTVTLPSDAKLFVDGKPTTSTGNTRHFTTPPLPFGHVFQYTLRVELVSGAGDLRPKPPPDQTPEPSDSDDTDPKPPPPSDDSSPTAPPEGEPEPNNPNDGGPKPPPGRAAETTVIVIREVTVEAGSITEVDFGNITVRGKE